MDRRYRAGVIMAVLAAGAADAFATGHPAIDAGTSHAVAAPIAGPEGAAAMRWYGLDSSGATIRLAPPLLLTIACNNVPMARLLLDHGADLYLPPRGQPERRGYPVLMAAVYREAAMLRLFLDHGLNPCGVAVTAAHPLGEVAAQAGLPADLVARLTCTRQADPP